MRPTSKIFTAGEILPNGDLLDLIRSGNGTALTRWNGKRSASRAEIRSGPRRYLPISVPDDVSHAMVLPDGIQPSGSTTRIFRELCHVFEHFGGQKSPAAFWCAFFTIASWLAGAMPSGLRFEILGPKAAALRILQLLACLCRHPLPLYVTNKSELFIIPPAVQPTLLVHAEDANRATQRLLRSPAGHGLLVQNPPGNFVDFTVPIAFYSGEYTEDRGSTESRIVVPITPLPARAPSWNVPTAQEIARKFQPRLLDYRLHNFAAVSGSVFDAAELSSPLREDINVLGACIVGADELRTLLVKLAAKLDEDSRAERSHELVAVVVEAALACCHQEGLSKVYVGDLAEKVNLILKARGTKLQLEPEAVGARLRGCGIFRERLGSKGRGFYLTESVQQRIHQLARSYDVPSVRNGKNRCPFCSDGRAQAAKT